jgi:hypothetical protein
LVLEEFVLKEKSSVVLTSTSKWLNIILDINDILCHCMEEAAKNRMPFINFVNQRVHSSMVPTIVELKAIFMRRGLMSFLV